MYYYCNFYEVYNKKSQDNDFKYSNAVRNAIIKTFTTTIKKKSHCITQPDKGRPEIQSSCKIASNHGLDQIKRPTEFSQKKYIQWIFPHTRKSHNSLVVFFPQWLIKEDVRTTRSSDCKPELCGFNACRRGRTLRGRIYLRPTCVTTLFFVSNVGDDDFF